MADTITSPAIEINNNVVAIVPNSFKYTEGKGEQTVNVQSSGGGSVDIAISRNVETSKSMASFDVFSTKENIDFFRAVKSQPGLNVVVASSGDFTRTITQATMINDAEINLQTEGKFTVDFEGLPSI